jgi:retron-type reverse transcriptase
MQSIKNIYEKIYDFENLHKAWEEARKGKRYRDDVLIFNRNYEEQLINIQNHLIYETYEVGKYHTFYVYEPKKRLIMSLPFKDRIVQWAIYRQLFPLYEKTFIFDSYACRKGKGTHKAADRLQYWLRQTERKPERYYYLKMDISKYFYRVDHDILLKILARRIKDQRLLNLLEKIINCESMNFGLPPGKEPDEVEVSDRLGNKGMPIGNLTSQMFANIYLNEVDQYAKHELGLHYYIRYMDDIIILHHDKKHLAEVKELLRTFLADELRLDLNNKTAIRPCSMGVDFVGFRIWATHRRLKKKTEVKIKRNLKRQIAKVKAGEERKDRLDRSVASYRGILSHFNSYGLRRKLHTMYIDSAAIITIASVLGALTAIGAVAYKIIKWFQAQEKQTTDIEDLKKQEKEDIKAMEDELCLLTYAVLACLKGLKEQGCNGPVTEAIGKIEKHINQKAHGQET